MAGALTNIGAVVIGRNEGERLKRCLPSLSAVSVVVYVDFGSTDGSAQWAHAHGVKVVELDMTVPFTAARARNSGFRQLQRIAPQIDYVQFVDGDCELVGDWLYAATFFCRCHIRILAPCAAGAASASPKNRFTTGCAIGSGRVALARSGVAAAT